MTLAIGWLHEAGDPPHPALRGGSMTLAIRWLHEGGETLGTWLHEAGDWHDADTFFFIVVIQASPAPLDSFVLGGALSGTNVAGPSR